MSAARRDGPGMTWPRFLLFTACLLLAWTAVAAVVVWTMETVAS